MANLFAWASIGENGKAVGGVRGDQTGKELSIQNFYVHSKGWYIIRPKSIDTPLDIRTRVETEKDILSIPSPYIGMVVYVKDTGKRFEVLTLKDKNYDKRRISKSEILLF